MAGDVEYHEELMMILVRNTSTRLSRDFNTIYTCVDDIFPFFFFSRADSCTRLDLWSLLPSIACSKDPDTQCVAANSDIKVSMARVSQWDLILLIELPLLG